MVPKYLYKEVTQYDINQIRRQLRDEGFTRADLMMMNEGGFTEMLEKTKPDFPESIDPLNNVGDFEWLFNYIKIDAGRK